MTDQRHISINIPVLTRVEGEGALDLEISQGQITKLNLNIYEPPRYFEKLLEGRDYQEVPDIVARICGICPVAYQMSAVQALERAFNIQIDNWALDLRRLMYCGEWIQSHSLHIHLLALPDYFDCNSVIELSQKQPQVVQRGLRLQALGNDIIKFLGGRSVHPVGVRVGGFHISPPIDEAKALLPRVQQCLKESLELLEWLCTLNVPDSNQEITFIALHHKHEYPMYSGRIVSSQGLDISCDEFARHFTEQQVPYSTALHAFHNDKPYLVGPLARLNLNSDKLPDEIRHILNRAAINLPSNNMFHSLIARAIEIYIALAEANRLLITFEPSTTPYKPVQAIKATGFGCTEAPRGLLWHHYTTQPTGQISYARIVPPTSQNQARIEEDLRDSIQQLGFDKPDAQLRKHAEMVIRNYDPCISCATHFLKLSVHRL